MSKEIKRTVCPYDCPDTCGILAEVVDGKVVKVTGDPEHSFTQGSLCVKMNHYEKTVYSPERLTTPLQRIGKKGEGKFQPISWEKAIAEITSRWQKIIEEYGAEAILPYSYAGTMGVVQRNCGEAFFHRLGASRLLRTICSSAKTYGWSAVMGKTLSIRPQEAGESDFIILWGTNALATNIHLLRHIRQAQGKGATVWLIDTYKSPTSKIADNVVMVRPGSDGALALGIMHLLIKHQWVDRDFISTHVHGFDKLEAEVLPDYPPAQVSAITGVDEDTLYKLAEGYAQARAPFISLGSGLSRYGNGAMTVRTIACLPALVGAWRKPGGGLLSSVGTSAAFPNHLVTRPDFQAQPTRIVNMNQLGQALTQLSDPPVMSIYVYHSNPATVAPDQNQVLQGLEREDLFCVVHERFMTDTARYADIVLPATTSLEHPDLYRAYGKYNIQKAEAVIPPIGQAKSNWEVFQLLAQSFGFQEEYFSQSAEDLMEKLLDGFSWPEPVDLEKVREGMPVELPLPKDYKMSFQTPSGKIQIYNPNEEEPLPTYKPPHSDNDQETFYFMSTPSQYSLNSSFNERPDLVENKGKPTLLMNPEDAQAKGLANGQKVIAFNTKGEVTFILKVTTDVPQGTLVSEGLFWQKDSLGNRTINALTSQRLTDQASASTLYDVKVDVRPA